MGAFIDPSDAHFWVTIALAVFLVILWRVGAHGMVGKALDAAGEKVRAQLDEAARLRAEAAQVLEEIKTRHAETEALAARMLAEAEEEAARLTAESHRRLEEDAARRSALAERRIAIAEAQAAQEVKAAAVEMAAKAAEAVLAERLAAGAQDSLIDHGIDQLSARLS